jgi:hypothetical protein
MRVFFIQLRFGISYSISPTWKFIPQSGQRSFKKSGIEEKKRAEDEKKRAEEEIQKNLELQRQIEELKKQIKP